MLKILRIEPAAEADLEMDDYIPLKVRFRKGLVPAPLIWYIQDAQSLLEVEIDRGSQSIVEVTLTSYHKFPQRVIPRAFLSVKQASGLPVVDSSIIPRRKNLSDPFDFRMDFLELTTGFVVYLDQHLIVVFDKETVPSTCYRVGRFGFFEGNQRIIGVGLFDLSEREKAMLEFHFRDAESAE